MPRVFFPIVAIALEPRSRPNPILEYVEDRSSCDKLLRDNSEDETAISGKEKTDFLRRIGGIGIESCNLMEKRRSWQWVSTLYTPIQSAGKSIQCRHQRSFTSHRL